MAACEKLHFAGFELDTQTHELLRNGRAVKLAPQALRLLEFLAARPGRLLTRQEIRQEIWSDTTFVDFEQGINKSIRQIRDALNDSAERPRFVETLPRRGYRFIANVERPQDPPTAAPTIDSADAAVVIAPVSEDGSESSKEEPASRPDAVIEPAQPARWWPLIVGAVAVLIAVGGLAKIGVERSHSVRPIQSLAVLPLENLSPDAGQEYFADGMTDDLITDLAKISELRVISRTSIMQYKGTKKTIAQIARELNVDAVLEGTVTRDRDRVRITAQLIQGIPERHLWADKYEGSSSEVLDLQDSVAKAVADEIQIKLTQKEHALLTAHRAVNPAAYEAYLKGRHLWDISGEDNLQKSKEYFEQAIDIDPGYALAWSGLADAYNRLASWGVLPRHEAAPRARAAAQRALELDDSLVNPLVALAEVKMNFEWDWAGSERLCRQAIAQNPNSGEARSIYATYLAEVGRTEEAVAEAQKSHEVEPLSDIIAVNVVWKLYLARRYKEAESEWHRQYGWVHRGDYVLASVYLQEGRQQDAIEELKKGAAQPSAGALELMYLGHVLGVAGARPGGQRVLQQILDLSKQRYVPPEYIAIVYEGLGERNQAIQWFEKAYAERSMNSWILPDPRLDNIRTDPRFKDIVRRMGLPTG